MTIEEIVDNFQLLEDWEDRYRYLIDLEKSLPPMPEALKTDTARVRGCMSQVWMVLGRDPQGRLQLVADSDARIVRGLIAVLRATYEGRTTAEAAQIDIDRIFSRLGLDQHLSPNRRNGFRAMVERIRAFIADGR